LSEEKEDALSNRFGFRTDVKIPDFLKETKFSLSAEVIPPRNGAEQGKVLEQIDALTKSGADFLSVTKGAGGSLRGGSLPIAQTIKEGFQKPCIAHFTCRDLTPQEVENQLMDHHYFGVRNILALRGDPPADQPNWRPHEQSLQYAYQLIGQIEKLNEGEFLQRPSDKEVSEREKTDFSIGAAAYPEHPNIQKRIEFFKIKVRAGADFGITQMLFDPAVYAQFLELCDKESVDIPVLPGTLILKSQLHAQKMAKRFGVQISQDWMKALPDKSDPSQLDRQIEYFLAFVEKLKSYGAPGVHLFVLSDTISCSNALKYLSAKRQ